MTSPSLTDADFDRLSSVLERFGNQRSMNVEQLDGFLAAFTREMPNISAFCLPNARIAPLRSRLAAYLTSDGLRP
jgi:hypothetical protein